MKNQVVQYLVAAGAVRAGGGRTRHRSHRKAGRRAPRQVVKQYFGGDRKKYETQLKEQGSRKGRSGRIRGQLVSEKIFAKVTGKEMVTEPQIAAYYAKSKAQYSQPESREVRHILVKTKKKADISTPS